MIRLGTLQCVMWIVWIVLTWSVLMMEPPIPKSCMNNLDEFLQQQSSTPPNDDESLQYHHYMLSSSTTTLKSSSNASTSVPSSQMLASKFDWKILDTDRGDIACGGNKCFFRHIDDSSIGYLVQWHQENNPYALERNLRAYELAIQLQQDYQMNHFYLEPPFLKRMDSNNVERMTSLNLTVMWFDEYWTFKSKKFDMGKDIILQKMIVAPKSCVFVGADYKKIDKSRDNLKQLWNKVMKTEKDRQRQQRWMFEKTFLNEFNNTLQMIHDHPEFYPDLQMMVDDQGHIYHLDLDRCFKRSSAELRIDLSKSKRNQMEHELVCAFHEAFPFFQQHYECRVADFTTRGRQNDPSSEDDDDGEDEGEGR